MMYDTVLGVRLHIDLVRRVRCGSGLGFGVWEMSGLLLSIKAVAA
jgi:hypothetical protein